MQRVTFIRDNSSVSGSKSGSQVLIEDHLGSSLTPSNPSPVITWVSLGIIPKICLMPSMSTSNSSVSGFVAICCHSRPHLSHRGNTKYERDEHCFSEIVQHEAGDGTLQYLAMPSVSYLCHTCAIDGPWDDPMDVPHPRAQLQWFVYVCLLRGLKALWSWQILKRTSVSRHDLHNEELCQSRDDLRRAGFKTFRRANQVAMIPWGTLSY